MTLPQVVRILRRGGFAIETSVQGSEAAIPPVAEEEHPAPAAELPGTIGRSGDSGPFNGHRPPAASLLITDNPRSKPSLDLPLRTDTMAGE